MIKFVRLPRGNGGKVRLRVALLMLNKQANGEMIHVKGPDCHIYSCPVAYVALRGSKVLLRSCLIGRGYVRGGSFGHAPGREEKATVTMQSIRF